MPKIWFFRHGESEANRLGKFAGQREDSELTEKGIEQARTAAQELKAKGIIFSKLIFSPLARTRESAIEAQRILEIADGAIVSDERILEYDMGTLTGTPIRNVSSSELTSAEGAEDPVLFRDRVLNFFAESQTWPEGHYLVVSHAGVGRCLEAAKLNMDPRSFYDLEAYPNAHAIELDLTWLRRSWRRSVGNLKDQLKAIEATIKNTKELWNGKPIEGLGLRPREALVNWLHCAVLQHLGADVTFGEDYIGDGILIDRKTATVMPTEHVSALFVDSAPSNLPPQERIIAAINKKIKKGKDYGKGKILMVLADGRGPVNPEQIMRTVGPHHFESIVLIALRNIEDPVAYTLVDMVHDKSYVVQFNPDFSDWDVEEIRI